jgi:hypothetical protein
MWGVFNVPFIHIRHPQELYRRPQGARCSVLEPLHSDGALPPAPTFTSCLTSCKIQELTRNLFCDFSIIMRLPAATDPVPQHWIIPGFFKEIQY